MVTSVCWQTQTYPSFYNTTKLTKIILQKEAYFDNLKSDIQKVKAVMYHTTQTSAH